MVSADSRRLLNWPGDRKCDADLIFALSTLEQTARPTLPPRARACAIAPMDTAGHVSDGNFEGSGRNT